MKTFIFLLHSSFAVVLLFSSCNKTAPSAYEPARTPRFEIILQPYQQQETMDSAIVQSEVNGIVKKVALNRSGDTLFCAIDSVLKGEGTLFCTLYPNKLVAGRKLLWTTEKRAYRNNGNQLLSYKGPVSFTDSVWLPRLYIPDPVLNLTFIAGLRATDSYFLLENVNPRWVDIEVYKELFKTKGGVMPVASASFACFNNCPFANRRMENIHSFAGIPNQVGGRSWDHIEITASFGDGDYRNGWLVLSFNYNIPE